MAALGEHSNVYDTAIALIVKKGFEVWYEPEKDHFFAEKNGWDFCSDSPCGLLGLIAIFEEISPESFEPYWWKIDTEIDSRKLPREKPKYRPIWAD